MSAIAAARSARNTGLRTGANRLSVEIVTPRQLELLALYASGYSYSNIGEMKFLSPFTVRNNLALALRRSNARSLTHLCVALLEARMIARNPDGDYEPMTDLRLAE